MCAGTLLRGLRVLGALPGQQEGGAPGMAGACERPAAQAAVQGRCQAAAIAAAGTTAGCHCLLPQCVTCMPLPVHAGSHMPVYEPTCMV